MFNINMKGLSQILRLGYVARKLCVPKPLHLTLSLRHLLLSKGETRLKVSYPKTAGIGYGGLGTGKEQSPEVQNPTWRFILT